MSINLHFISNESNNLSIIFNKIIPYNHETIYGGNQFTFSFYFKNSNDWNLTIFSIKSITRGFNVSNVNPSLPVELLQYNGAMFEITILVPDENFAGSLDIDFYVTQ